MVLFLLCLLPGAPEGARAESADGGERDQVVRVGVLANRGKEMCLAEWGPTADYLGAQLAPRRFEIVPLDFTELQRAAEERRVDFLIANSSMYVALEYRGVAYRIATFLQPSPLAMSPSPEYGGVIFCRADRGDISSLRDFSGKRFRAVDRSSLGGWQAAYREFARMWIRPERDFLLEFTGSQDAVVWAVLNGKTDGGTVRSTQLERMAAEGVIDLAEIRVFDATPNGKSLDYPFLLSTRLYPEWPFAVIKGTDLELAKAAAAALIRMSASDPAALASKGAGWTIPQDYASVHQCLRELRLPPYENFGKVTLAQAMAQHWRFLLGMLAVSAAMLFLVIRTRRTSARLTYTVSALARAKEEWERTFDAMPDMIAIIDREHRITRLNKTMAENLGRTPAQCVGEHCHALVHCSADPPELCPHVKLLEKGIPYAAEIYEPSLNCYLDITVTPFFDSEERLSGSIHVARDVTERRKADRSLRESGETFRRLFEDSANPILLLDDERIIDCNPATMKLFGYSREELLSSTPWGLSPPEQPDGSNSVARAEEMRNLARQEGSHQFEWVHRKADGSDFHVSVVLTPIIHRGQPILHATLHDISQQKRAESERLQLERQVQQALKTESLSRMAGAVAHHFNNMLGAALGNLELALDEMPPELEQRKFIAEAYKASLRAAEISRFMLTYLGRTTGKKEPLDLVEAAVEALSLISDSVPKDVRLETHFPTGGLVIEANGAQVKQILTNLLTNAVEAVGEGVGSITVEIREIEAAAIRDSRLLPTDWAPAAARYALLTVFDTGEGLDAMSQEKAFEPFFSTKFLGRGLGLPVVLGLVRVHEGAVGVESQPGEGALFKVFLPLAERKEPASRERDEAPAAAPPGAAGPVLLVDDEPMVRAMAESMLFRRLGYEAPAAENGAGAIDSFEKRGGNSASCCSTPACRGWTAGRPSKP
jgi:PAS domain S-box-containing protein